MKKESKITNAINRLKVEYEMMCDKEFNSFLCKDCDFFFVNQYRAGSCLKQNIKEWTLYRMSKGE